jgi:hypothetical protein
MFPPPALLRHHHLPYLISLKLVGWGWLRTGLSYHDGSMSA